MIGWWKIWKILKPWKGVLCFHFRVCLSVPELQSTSFDIGTILGTWERNAFFCFSKFSFLPFLWAFFDFFPYITLVNFCFQSTGHSFWLRDVIFWLIWPFTNRKKRLLKHFENSIFYRQIGHFSDFLTIFQYKFGDSWDIHGMRPIILGYFFPTITMEISTFHFRTSMIQGG